VRAAIEAVVFDIGGVLLDWNPRHLYRKLFDDEAEMERFLSEVCTPEWHAAHDRGVDMERSCARLAADHPEQADLVMAWVWRSEEMVAGTIPGTLDVVEDLRAAGVPCYALTNIEAETYPLRVERFPFLTSFDGIVVSAHEGIAKPDPEIFRRLLDRFGLHAATTLMIDDTQANLDAAAELGMQTLRFESAERLRGFLQSEGVL
jgi:2-haloacid dehalogenase